MAKDQKPPDFLDPGVEAPKFKIKTISKTFSKQVLMSLHGGVKFETATFGETRTASVLPGMSTKEIGRQLMKDVQAGVERDIRDFDKQMEASSAENGDPDQEAPKKAKKDDIGVDKDELIGIKDLLQQLIDATTLKDLAKLQDEIKERQDLTESQLTYLRKKYSSKAKKIQDAQ